MTNKDIVVTPEWQCIDILMGVPTGTEMTVRFKPYLKMDRVYFVEGDEPPKKSLVGDWLDTIHPEVTLLSGSGTYWFRTKSTHATLHVRSA